MKHQKVLAPAFMAVLTGILSSLPFVGAGDPDTFSVSKTDSITTKNVLTNTLDERVMEFSLTNDFATSAEVTALQFVGLYEHGTNAPLEISGSGFSIGGNLKQVLSGSGSTLDFTGLSGISLAPAESKTVLVDLGEVSSSLFSLNSIESPFKLNLSGVTLASGSGVVLGTGSGISISNPLESGNIKIFPDVVSVQNYFPVATSPVIPLNAPIIGNIPGSFDLTDFSVSYSVTVDSVPKNDFTVFFDKANRKFTLTPLSNYASGVDIVADVNLTDGTIMIDGSSLTFQATQPSEPSSVFSEEVTFTTDKILPIDFNAQTFSLTKKLSLENPGENIAIEIPAGTTMGKKAGAANFWGGEMQAPKVKALPDEVLFEGALGKPENEVFVPLKSFSVGSSTTSIEFNKNVTMEVKIDQEGVFAIYSSENGTSWERENTCTVTRTDNGVCTFSVSHFTDFAIGTEGATQGGGGGQNSLRNGGTPGLASFKTSPPKTGGPNNFIRVSRSNRNKRLYPKCNLGENDDFSYRYYDLVASQNGATKCRDPKVRVEYGPNGIEFNEY